MARESTETVDCGYGRDMMLFKPKIDNEKEKIVSLIRRRRRQILVHSCLYYKMSVNIVTDEEFDRWCSELRELHKKYPQYMKINCYDDAFSKWGGYSGFDLPTDDDIRRIAQRLVRIKQEMEKMDNEYMEICKEAGAKPSPDAKREAAGK